MIPYEHTRKTVVSGLKKYVGCNVVKSNQPHDTPVYPFISYTVTIPMSVNKGTWQHHDNGIRRKSVLQTWSITAVAADATESVLLANKAREWFELVGRTYMQDNNVIVASVTQVSNRDTYMNTEYEYRNGFDVVFRMYDEVDFSPENDLNNQKIESITIRDNMIERNENQ